MEIIVRDLEDFNILKQFASYSSELTRVIEIPDARIAEIKIAHEDILNKYCNVDAIPDMLIDLRPKVFALKNKLYIEGIDDELATYLNLPADGEIKLVSLQRFMELIDSFNITESAKPYFTKVNEDDDISTLYTSRFAVNYKHTRWSLDKHFNKVGELNLDTREAILKKYRVFKNLEVERIEGNSVFCKGDVELRFFFLSFQQKAAFQPGKLISVMTEKVYGRNKKILISPEIVPKTFPKEYIRIEVKSTKRDIPAKLLKVAYTEYKMRNR